MKRIQNNPEAGLALPAAVWAALVLFLMTASVLNLTLGQGQQVSFEQTLLERKLATESAFMIAIKALHNDKTGDKKGVISSPIQYQTGEYQISVSISAEAGKVNLNLADKDLISALLIEAGLSRAESDTFSESLIDFRSAERPFRSLNEALKVMQMDPVLFGDLRPDLTLYSDRAGVRADYASSRLKRALAAAGDEFSQSGGSVLKPSEFETGTTWSLKAEVTNLAGKKISKIWVIRLTGNNRSPYLLHVNAV